MIYKEEHNEHCKEIADRLEAVVAGEMVRCPECWEMHNRDDFEEVEEYHCPECGAIVDQDAETCHHCGEEIDPEDMDYVEGYKCPECGEIVEDSDDLEEVTLFEWLEDGVYNEEYTVTRSGGTLCLRGVRIMIACGGPNIYLNTNTGDVELRWWGDAGRYPMSAEVYDEIDAMFTEILSCDGYDVER